MRFGPFIGFLLALGSLEGAVAQSLPEAPARAECAEALTVSAGRTVHVLQAHEGALRTVHTHRVRRPWRGLISEVLYACEHHKLVVNGTRPYRAGIALWTSLIDVRDASVQAVTATGAGDNQFFLSGAHAWRVTVKAVERLHPDDPRWPALALESIDLDTGQVSLSPRTAYGGGKIWPLSGADWVVLSSRPYAHESSPPTRPPTDPPINFLPTGEKIDAPVALWATSTRQLVMAQSRCHPSGGWVESVTLQARARGALHPQPIAEIEMPVAHRLFGDRHGALIIGEDRAVYVDLATGLKLPVRGWPAGWQLDQAAATPASVFVLMETSSGTATARSQTLWRLDRAQGRLLPLNLPLHDQPINLISTSEPGVLVPLPRTCRSARG